MIVHFEFSRLCANRESFFVNKSQQGGKKRKKSNPIKIGHQICSEIGSGQRPFEFWYRNRQNPDFRRSTGRGVSAVAIPWGGAACRCGHFKASVLQVGFKWWNLYEGRGLFSAWFCLISFCVQAREECSVRLPFFIEVAFLTIGRVCKYFGVFLAFKSTNVLAGSEKISSALSSVQN